MRLQAVEQWQQHVEEQIQKLEAAGATAAPPQTSGGRWPDVQEELERFRKLFEFIEGVLPQDAAEAMRFFNQRSLASSKGLAQSLGPEVDIERNRVKWENDFQNTTSDLHHEFDNLMLVIKVLQRDADVSVVPSSVTWERGCHVSRRVMDSVSVASPAWRSSRTRSRALAVREVKACTL